MIHKLDFLKEWSVKNNNLFYETCSHNGCLYLMTCSLFPPRPRAQVTLVWRVTEGSKCAATCCAKVGVSLSCLLSQQPAYPPKCGTLLHPAFFVVPAALAAAAMAHGVLCSRHRANHLLQEKRWERTAFWNSVLLNLFSCCLEKRKGSLLLKALTRAVWREEILSFIEVPGWVIPPWSDSALSTAALPRTPPSSHQSLPKVTCCLQGILMAQRRAFSQAAVLGSIGTVSLTLTLFCIPAPGSLADICLKQVCKYPGVSRPAFLRNLLVQYHSLNPTNAWVF